MNDETQTYDEMTTNLRAKLAVGTDEQLTQKHAEHTATHGIPITATFDASDLDLDNE